MAPIFFLYLYNFIYIFKKFNISIYIIYLYSNRFLYIYIYKRGIVFFFHTHFFILSFKYFLNKKIFY